MKRIAVYPNGLRDHQYEMTNKLLLHIAKGGGRAVIEPEFAADALAEPLYEKASYETCDLMICLGGDGTFLSATHHPSAHDLPLIGVNLGSVGFLPEIETSEIAAAVPRLLSGDYTIEHRMMLECSVYDSENREIARAEALNDVSVVRGAGNSRILTVDLMIDDVAVERIPGDGIIVSSPTGSTAYSLAAGGPIAHPGLDIIMITPICPHTLHNRTYLAGKDATVRLSVQDGEQQVLLSIDGKQLYALGHGAYAAISRSHRVFDKIRLGGDVFYQTLPKKIQLRGVSR